MSEVQKPVEEPVAAVKAETAPAVEEPVVEDKVAEPVPETVTEPAPAVEEAAPVATEETPVAAESAAAPFAGEGVLSYKVSGGNFIKKLAGYQKKFFWFGAEPVETKKLSNYLRGEKAEVGSHNAAWSSQTGKGLLYYSKAATEKATPAGIINLSDMSEITEEATIEFHFTSQGNKHSFQAPNSTERAAWIAALKTASTEAKESAEGITSSESYKESHASLSKPAMLAGAAAAVTGAATVAAKTLETKKDDKAEAKEEKKEEKAEAKEEKKDRKSRSASRKRNSIFGGLGFGSKKEEAAVEPVPAVVAPVEAETEAAPVAAAVEEPVVAPVETPVVAPVAAPVATEPVVAETAPVAETSKPLFSSKRGSIFGGFSSKFGAKKATSEAAPATPAKEEPLTTEPVTTEAPVIPAPEASEPLAAETVTNDAPAADTAAVIPETTPEAVKEVKAERRKSSLPSFSFNKIKQTVKSRIPSRSTERASDKAVEPKAEEPVVDPKAEEPVAETPTVASEPTPAAVEEPVAESPMHKANPVVAATA